MLKKLGVLLPVILLSGFVYSQNDSVNIISGSFETNSIYYFKDSLINAKEPKDKIGSNSYFKLDFRRGNLSAGIQYEAYLPPLLGYSPFYEGNGIVHRYATYTNDLLSVTAGNFYEQFGSGIVFRTFEERSLGINTALDGVSVKICPLEALQIKMIWGKQVKYFDIAQSNIRGTDAELSISKLLFNESELSLSIGGSWVNKYEKYTGPSNNVPLMVSAYAGRLQLDFKAYNLYVEYANKSKDPSFTNLYSLKRGSGLLVNQGLSINNLGTLFSFRRLENMDFRSERDEAGSGLVLNYLPALTMQHRYALASFHPYSTRSKGEIGGQIDVFYKFGKGTFIGGASGLKAAINFSNYYTLDYKNGKTSIVNVGDTLLFKDFSFELDKKLSNRIKSTFSFISQQYNKGALTGGDEMVVQHIVAMDVNFKTWQRASAKIELSELFGKKHEDDWSYIAIEMSTTPHWTFYISDMIQHRAEKVHFYKGGISYNNNTTKVSLSFGRSREGLQCVSGMCRLMPAYTGINLSLITSF